MGAGVWGKFRQAAEHLKVLAKKTPNPDWAASANMAIAILEKAPKFYVPNILEVTSSKDGPDVGERIRLPYPIMALLTECKWNGDMKNPFKGDERTHTWSITLAIQPDADGDVSFMSVSYAPPDKSWLFYPVTLRATPSGIAKTVHVSFMRDPATEACLELVKKDGISVEDFARDFSVDMDAMIGLWRLLEVHDTKTRVVPLPKALASNTRKWGVGKGGYDYHVLSVGGEVWDSPHETTGTGNSVRSHLRRGHIRRLEGRTTWVRATYVHGGKEGFVDKDYTVNP